MALPPEHKTIDENHLDRRRGDGSGSVGSLGAAPVPQAEMQRSFASTAYDIDNPEPPSGSNTLDSLIGKQIDHFLIRGQLGQGGMGTVYLAQDLSLERPVAIKVLRSEFAHDNELTHRLVLEARAQARLSHPNVVNVYHIGSYEGAPYFAMEFVRGHTLAERLSRTGPLPWGEALDYVIQTTRVLMQAKSRGIVHRDIKPSNLIVNEAPGSKGQIKVADFGLAAPPGFRESRFVGSPYYASPEHMQGHPPDHRSDMYSLGVTFHELITGQPPFQADSLKEISKLHSLAPRPQIPDRDAPWRLRQLIREMMDPDPTKRPWSYEELLAGLEGMRPKPVVAGGLVARGIALSIDLVLFAIVGQILVGAMALSQRRANEASFLLFGLYYVLGHRYLGFTLGKRVFGLRIQGTTRAVGLLSLTLRFVVEFWGPITALVMISLQLGAAYQGTNMADVKDRLTTFVGMQQIPVIDAGTDALLRTLLVPNLVLAIPWVAGFLFAWFDDNRLALHDRVARTRVIYAVRVEAGNSADSSG